MKNLFLTLFLISSYSLSIAQTGSIKGKIVTSDSKPAAFVNIGLEGHTFGTVTSMNGEFELNKIPKGEYILVASYVGLKTQKKEVIVIPNQVTQVPVLKLEEDALKLSEVIIEASKNRYAEEESKYVAKMSLKKIENPQVYNSIPSTVLDDQIITEFDDAIKNAPGIVKLWESTGRANDGAGYYSLRGFSVQPSMVNGVPALSNGSPDPANIESIEVIKGPSGTLYGSSLISYGGLINIETKKPYHTFGGNIGYTLGSFGLNRITTDINTPLSDEKNVALRFVSAYETKNSFQDAGFSKSLFIAPSLSYIVNKKLSFFINTEIYSFEGTNPTMLFFNRSSPLAYTNLDELGYNNERSYTSNDITINNPSFNLQGQMLYKLNEKWTLQTVASSSNAKTDGYYSYLFARSIGKVFDRYISRQNSTTLGTDIQQNIIGDFTIGNFRNRVVAGVDFFSQEVINQSTGYIAFDNITINGADPSQLSLPAVQGALTNTSIGKSSTVQNIYSAYISDVFNFTPQLSAMASVRIDHFDNQGTTNALLDTTTGVYSQSTLSPKFGLVYEILDDKLSVFANYMNGFSNVAPRVQNDGTTVSFEPEQANQKEFGVKSMIWEGRAVASISYYDIEVSDVVRNNPEKVGFFVQDGSNYSRGVEIDITTSPIAGLNILLGYSYNESEISKTDNQNIIGRRPEEAGPQNLGNAWFTYQLTRGKFEGLGIGFGGNYFGENMLVNKASTGKFTLPSYVILNGTVFYNTDSYRIGLKANNLTDEEYYTGWTTLNPQMPLNILANFTYKI